MGPTRMAGRGTAKAGGVSSWRALRGGAGSGRGRHEAAEGLGRPGVDEGRWGETGSTHAAGRGAAEAGGTGGQRALRGRAVRPARG
jgi:hypothetical protein